MLQRAPIRPFPDEFLAELALEARQVLSPGLGPLEPVPIGVVIEPIAFTSLGGCLRVQALPHEVLPPHVLGLSTFDLDSERAWIWLNDEAWPEFRRDVPRTRFTVAHELAHCLLHSEELAALRVRAEPDHNEQLESEANRLAGQILVPDQALRRLPSSGSTDLAKRFRVTVGAADRRLREWSKRS